MYNIMETVIDIHGHIINKSLMPDAIFLERIGVDGGIDSDIINKIGKFLEDNKSITKIIEWVVDNTYGDVEVEPILRLYFSTMLKYLQSLMNDMDKAKVDKMVVLMLELSRWDNSSNGLDFYKECRFFNSLKGLTGGRVLGFIGLDLDHWLQEYYEDKTKALKLIKHADGIKLYPKIGYRVDDDIFNPFFEYCEHVGTPITTHTSKGGIGMYDDFGSPSRWSNVLFRYPELYLNLAHLGGEFTKWSKHIIRLCMEFQNLYTDVAFHSGSVKDTNEYFDKLIELFDEIPDKILLGTDYPLHTVYYSYSDVINIYRKKLHPFYFELISHYNPTDFLTNR